MRILILEDSEVAGKLLARRLEIAEDVDVEYADNLKDALAAIESEDFDAVIFGEREVEDLARLSKATPMSEADAAVKKYAAAAVSVAFVSVIIALCFNKELPVDSSLFLFLMMALGAPLGISVNEIIKALPKLGGK